MDKNGIDAQAISLTNPSVSFSAVDAQWAGRPMMSYLMFLEIPRPFYWFGSRFSGAQSSHELKGRYQAWYQGVCLYSHFRNEYLDNQKYGF
jgi:hypothetical protein